MSHPMIIVEVGTDPEERSRVFGLFGESLKRDSISRLPSGRWEVSLPIGLSNEIRVYTRSRRDAETAVDELMKLLADPEQAHATYTYLWGLSARARARGFDVAGDLIEPEGTVRNVDVKSEMLQ